MMRKTVVALLAGVALGAMVPQLVATTAAQENSAKKTYEYLDLFGDIFERVRDTVRDFAGGHMADLNHAFTNLARVTYRRAWRRGADHPSVPRVVEILRRTADEIEKEWDLD